MTKLYRFPCGCGWPLMEENPPEGVVPLLDFDLNKAPQNCPAVWDLLAKGHTHGIFQLESSLGKTWCRKLRPESLEHLSALGAILRPGCLKNVDKDGVSVTQHYARRKNGEEAVTGYHPAVDAVLAPTYGLLVYQEQSMALAQVVAGFNLQEADQLRKAIGKKLPEEMAKCKKLFLEGAKKEGVITEVQAEEIFGWIEKSQRYAFNKSHSYSYGCVGYETAYLKAHFPLAFYAAWLYQAREKQDPREEIHALVNEAKLFDIQVEPPDLRSLEPRFHTDRRVIKFGLSDIKGVGTAQIDKLKPLVQELETLLQKPLLEWSWLEFLVFASPRLNSSTVTRFIEAGALSYLKLGRQEMLAQYGAFAELTEKELGYVQTNFTKAKWPDLPSLLRAVAKPKKEGGGAANKNRISAILSQVQLLEKPATARNDTAAWLAYIEEQHLGIALTCSKVDACDLSDVNVTCKEFLAGRTGFLLFGVEIQRVRQFKTKRGKTPGATMAFLTISDGTCSLEDVVVFPDVYRDYQHLLTEGQTVILQGEREEKKGSQSLFVKKMWKTTRA